MNEQLTAEAARDALATIEQERRRVIDEIDMPRWYWWGLAAAWIGLGAITDLGRTALTVSATVLFCAALSAASNALANGRRRTRSVSVAIGTVGVRGRLIAFGCLMALAGATVAGAFAVKADHAHHPVTIVSCAVALAVVLGGPAVMASIRRSAIQSHPVA